LLWEERVSLSDTYDVFIVGGGINGSGIARDAVGRGFSVCLAEMNDLASGTSSGSTKLIHGGLRYLEFYEFRLVREALKEREVLWANAPHVIWPLRFILPHHSGLRPGWLLRLGLFLYDHIGGRKRLPATKTLNVSKDKSGVPLKKLFTKAFEYSDCWVDDARLVVLNARDAHDRGAQIMVRTKVVSAVRDDDEWRVTVEMTGGERREIRARVLVNAAGPWVDEFLVNGAGQKMADNVRLVQGSHIVVPSLFDDQRCYIFQNSDGRIVFAIPYEKNFTLVGTTDRDFHGDLGDVKISSDEIDYLCCAASEYFKNPIKPHDVVWTYSGVRPLYNDGASKAQEATRDYILKLDSGDDQAPLINIFGGKITTYRKLSENVVEMIERVLGARNPAWTKHAALPGGDFLVDGFNEQVNALLVSYPFLSKLCAEIYIRRYGTCAFEMLDGVSGLDDLGANFGHDLWEVEVRYLVEREWAMSAEDVLWRRTKQGLHLSSDEVAVLDDFIETLDAHSDRMFA